MKENRSHQYPSGQIRIVVCVSLYSIQVHSPLFLTQKKDRKEIKCKGIPINIGYGNTDEKCMAIWRLVRFEKVGPRKRITVCELNLERTRLKNMKKRTTMKSQLLKKKKCVCLFSF